MNHARRGRISVVWGDCWRDLSPPLERADMLGSVRFGGKTGALVRFHANGGFYLVNTAGRLRLPAQKVSALIAKAGQQSSETNGVPGLTTNLT